jgi:TP901 family phage tail tape measure protein
MPDRILRFKMLGNTTDFTSKWVAAQGTMNRVAATAQSVGQSVTKFGTGMTVGFTLPIVAGLGAGVKAFADFDKAMTESLAIMGDVSEQTRERMSALARQMSGESTFAAKELAGAYFFLASAGLDAEQSMAALPIVTKFAQAGAFDLASATDLLTDAYSALGPQIQKTGDLMTDMTGLGDLLVKANTLANATVEQFSEALTNEAGPAMRQWKIEMEDGVAVLAAYADQGIKGQKAGSMFGRAIRLLTKASIENADEFKKMGIEVFNSKGEFNSFADIAGDMERSLGGLSTQQRAVALDMLGFKARTQQAILPLIGSSDAIRKYSAELKKAGGIMNEVSQKQLKTFSNQMTLLKNRVVNAFGSLGEVLIPSLTAIADKIGEWTTKFQNLSPEMKKTIVDVALFVAGIGPVLLVVGKVISMFGTMIGVVQKLGTALLWLAANPAVLVAAAIVVTIALVVKAVNAFIEWRDALDDLAKSQEGLNEAVAAGDSARDKNAKRWQMDKDVLNELNGVLESNLSLSEKMSTLEAGLNLDLSADTVARLKEELALLQTQFNKQAAGPITAVKNPFVPSADDIKARDAFQSTLEKAVFDQLNTEQKINALMEKRVKLVDDMKRTQEGSQEYYEARAAVMNLDQNNLGLQKARAAEIQNQAKVQTDTFATAANKGSLEDYQMRIKTGSRDRALKIQEKQEKELKEIKKLTQKQIELWEQELNGRSVDDTPVFVIA